MRDHFAVWPLITELRAASVLPGAIIEVPGAMVPFWMALARSVRSRRAICTAPSTFSRPAPCCSRLAPASGCALYCRMAFTIGGVSPGLACSISATAPETAGAATEVPLSIISVWP